jgi:hypothetical protein
MKTTSNKLEFRETSGFWMSVLFGGSFLLFGLFFVYSYGGLFSYLLIVIGLLLMLFAQIENVTFDKEIGDLTFNWQQPFRCKTKVVKHALPDISGVEIQKIEDYESVKYRVCLSLLAGKRCVPLTSYFSTGLRDKQKTAEIIAIFLDIKNYDIEGFTRQQTLSEEPQWKTVEAEIAHWETAIANDSNDADARMKLVFALLQQDKQKNKKQAMSHLKQAEAIFKARGYDEEARQAFQLYGILYWEL